MSAPGRGHFWPQGSNLNNLTRSSYVSIINGLGLLLSDKNIFKVVPYTGLCKTNDPFRGAIFDPRAIIWTILAEVY